MVGQAQRSSNHYADNGTWSLQMVGISWLQPFKNGDGSTLMCWVPVYITSLKIPVFFSGLKTAIVSCVSLFNQSDNHFSGWWFGTFFLFFYIFGRTIPTDFHIFQRARYTTNQWSVVKRDFHALSTEMMIPIDSEKGLPIVMGDPQNGSKWLVSNGQFLLIWMI